MELGIEQRFRIGGRGRATPTPNIYGVCTTHAFSLSRVLEIDERNTGAHSLPSGVGWGRRGHGALVGMALCLGGGRI